MLTANRGATCHQQGPHPLYAVHEGSAGRLHTGAAVHRWFGGALRGAIRYLSDGIGAWLVQGAPQRSQQPVGAGRETNYVLRDQRGEVGCAGGAWQLRETRDKDAYVLFGSLRPIETPSMVGFMDPQLPEWLRGSFAQTVPDMWRGIRRSWDHRPA